MAPINFRRSMLPNKGPGAIWILLAVLAFGFAYVVWYNSITRDIQQLSYTQLLDQVESDNVAKLLVQDQRAQGELKNGGAIGSYIVQTARFWDTVRTHKVDVEVLPVEQQSYLGYFLFLFLVLITLLALFMFRQNQGGSGGGKIFSIGKSRARFFPPNTITVTFKDVAGVDEAKEDLRDIVEFLKYPEKFSRLGAKSPAAYC